MVQLGAQVLHLQPAVAVEAGRHRRVQADRAAVARPHRSRRAARRHDRHRDDPRPARRPGPYGPRRGCRQKPIVVQPARRVPVDARPPPGCRARHGPVDQQQRLAVEELDPVRSVRARVTCSRCSASRATVTLLKSAPWHHRLVPGGRVSRISERWSPCPRRPAADACAGPGRAQVRRPRPGAPSTGSRSGLPNASAHRSSTLPAGVRRHVARAQRRRPKHRADTESVHHHDHGLALHEAALSCAPNSPTSRGAPRRVFRHTATVERVAKISCTERAAARCRPIRGRPRGVRGVEQPVVVDVSGGASCTGRRRPVRGAARLALMFERG